MTDPREIQRQMQDAAQHLRLAIDELAGLAAARVRAEIEASEAYDQALVDALGSNVAEKEARARLKTKQLRRTAEESKSQEQVCKTKIRSWQSILSGWQSVASAYKSEANFARTGP